MGRSKADRDRSTQVLKFLRCSCHTDLNLVRTPGKMKAALIMAAAVGGVGAFCPGMTPPLGRAPSRACQGRSVRGPVVGLRAAFAKVVDGVTGTDELLDRQNAHVVGLLQNPFDEKGSSGAFPGMPEHLGRITEKPIAPDTPQLTPWGDNAAFPDRCPTDPFAIVREELSPFSDSIKDVVTTDHPILSEAAKHFFAERQVQRPPSWTPGFSTLQLANGEHTLPREPLAILPKCKRCDALGGAEILPHSTLLQQADQSAPPYGSRRACHMFSSSAQCHLRTMLSSPFYTTDPPCRFSIPGHSVIRRP